MTRSIVRPNGAILKADRARPKADFIASNDTWFRPASMATGPDGALYLADMYRLWVEHPRFLPPEISEKLDWRAGEDRGRIWRVVPADYDRTKATPYAPPRSTADLVEFLSSPNGWKQQLGHRLLVERGLRDAAPALRDLLRQAPREDTRQRALGVLDGIEQLTIDDLLLALGDTSPLVRQDAARLAVILSAILGSPRAFWRCAKTGRLRSGSKSHSRWAS